MRHVAFSISLSFIAIAILALFGYYHTSQAQLAGTISGFAWSSNIGWIKMDPAGNPSQDVTVNQGTGAFSGFAWSSNIGWIRFNPVSDGTGRLGVVVNTASGKVTGWARACSVFPDTNVPRCQGTMKPDSQRGGWDGWIEMAGTNHISPTFTTFLDSNGHAHGAGGVTYQTAQGRFIGFAWGGDVVGWMDFCNMTSEARYCVKMLAPVAIPLSLSANPAAHDLNAAGNASFTLTTTISDTNPPGQGSGNYKNFTYNCDNGQGPVNLGDIAPAPLPMTVQFVCSYTASFRGKRTVSVSVQRTGTAGGSQSTSITVKPSRPKFQEK